MRKSDGVASAGAWVLEHGHRLLLALTGGRYPRTVMGMLAVELHTVGRKSGKPYSNLLTSPVHTENSFVVVASKGGHQHHPDWYKNAIANELFLQVAAELHERTPGDAAYAAWAEREWGWFAGTGMLTGSHLVIDGLAGCKPDMGSPTWTYNQGMLIGALVSLARMTGQGPPLATAKRIADAVMADPALSPRGILREPCEPASCGVDEPLFKGIFMKNLKLLADRVGQARAGRPGGTSYRAYIRHNAIAVWSYDRHGDEFGLSWSGPFDSASTARQTSALDVLNTQVSAGRGG